MKRCALAVISLLSFLVLAAATLPATAATNAMSHPQAPRAGSSSYPRPLCQSKRSTCTDVANQPRNSYVGHDEPSAYLTMKPAGDRRNRPLLGCY